MNKEIEKFSEISSIIESCYGSIYDRGIRYSNTDFIIFIEAQESKSKSKDEIELLFSLEDFYLFNMASESLFSDYILFDYFEIPPYKWVALNESPLLEDIDSKCFDLAKKMGLLEFLVFTSGMCFQVISQSAPQLSIRSKGSKSDRSPRNKQ